MKMTTIASNLKRNAKRIAQGILLLAALLIQFPAFAQKSATLLWDPSPGSDVAGYKVHYGTASGKYSNVITVGNVTNATISGLVEGVTYYFVATAYNSFDLESEPSEEISYTIPLPVPSPASLKMNTITENGTTMLSITSSETGSTQWTLESSTDLKVWTDYTSGTGPVDVQIPMNEANRFFRLKSQ